jgi:site-specific recombinase XerD
MDQVKAVSRLPELERLVASALDHLKERGYGERSCHYYEGGWAALVRFARTTGLPCSHVRDLAAGFLASCAIAPSKGSKPAWSQTVIRRGLRILMEFQETGRFRPHEKRTEDPRLPKLLRQEQERYEAFCKLHLHHRTSTLATRRRTVTAFVAFLASRGVASPGELEAPLLGSFIAERARRVRPQSLATEVGGIRSFLRFLCMQGLVAPDLVAHARALRFSKEHRLPPVWSPGAVEALLSAVDRSSAVGKRDYAILLLASRLGLRACDIRALKLEDIHWAEARLGLTQTKTGCPLSLPLEELGQALIDYLRHARPSTSFREVFLKVRAPHEPLGPTNSLHSVIASTLRQADITLPQGMPRAVHSLRHTLATRLVQSGQRLETVAAVLGHRSIESTRIYTGVRVAMERNPGIFRYRFVSSMERRYRPRMLPTPRAVVFCGEPGDRFGPGPHVTRERSQVSMA